MLTLKDILKIYTTLSTISTEKISIRELEEKRERATNPIEFEEGLCDECGNMDLLYNLDNKMMCESCKDSL